jgi:beta-N-acetylhexosaminidase
VASALTPEQRVGQLFLIGLAHDQLGAAELAAIQEAHIGSVWFTETTSIGISGVREITDAVQAEVSVKATGGVPFFVAANQEGGQIQALQGIGFSRIPSAVAQGDMAIDALQANARRWGRDLSSAGVNLNFAPVADVVPVANKGTNQPIGVLDREYGNNPESAGSHAAAFVRGMIAAGVASTAKHFPGLGRVEGNTDFTGDVVDGVTTADDPSLGSFQATIDAGVPFVMVALATYQQIDPDHLAVFSPAVINEMLRGSLGFTGVVMSDDLGGAVAVAGIPVGDRAIDFLNAGGDLVVVKKANDAVAMAAAVVTRAQADAAFAAIVDMAALEVLQAKDAVGLLDCSSS